LRYRLIACLAFLFVLPLIPRPCAAQTAGAQSAKEEQLPAIAAKTAGMQKMPGFFDYYWDGRTGKIWLQVDKWNTPFLYVTSLPNGVGSNDIGLDRGQPDDALVVHFERSGPHVFLVAENERYRASADAGQAEAVKEAFAQSILWGFEVAAADGDTVLVDATSFYLRDAHNVIATLRAAGQGAFELDPTRCAIYLPRTKNFPENTDVEAILTFKFTGEKPAALVTQVTPDPLAITVHEHASFVQAPPPGFHPRAYDPRSGFFAIQYMDFSTPVDESIQKRFIERWRLEKRDPTAAVSAPVKPIVYYVDSATPEPIRSALIEGASWWNQAFTAAGYQDAFQVKVLPEGVDPMDIRYNVIEWVPRDTRGWSYGSAIVDPRTGEIINGHVTLDALRIRQVFLIAQGLLDPFGNDPTKLPEANEMALGRIRQLAAHETGHTLGLAHNYASSIVDRASVMDYPPPVVTLGPDGAPDGRAERAKVAEGACAFGQQGEFRGGVAWKHFAQPRRGIDQRGYIQQLGGREDRARLLQPLHPGSRIGQRPETQFAAGAQIGHRFRDGRKLALEARAIGSERQRIRGAAARCGGRSRAQ